MKKICFILLVTLYFFPTIAQDSLNVNLLYHWHDTTLALNYRDARYSECWGFEQGGREYGVIGSTYGCHIFDVTDPQNVVLVDEVPANLQGYNANHRDYHDYNGYLYAVGDQQPATLQIMDLSYLPDSVSLVYDSDSLFSTTHNIFIDTSSALLYALNPSSSQYSMFVYSLANPISPQLVYEYDGTAVVHDAYVRNDTAYLNCANNDGFRVYDFTTPSAPVLLASLTSYPHQGYNHSGWLTEDGSHYVFADENYGLDVKIADVSDFGNISVVSQFTSGVADSSIAHNIIIRGDYAYLSYYNDGLQIFDISDPNNPVKTGFYDTFAPSQEDDFRGAWGVYPYPTSKNVLVSDRNTGLYLFNVKESINSGEKDNHLNAKLSLFPNPTNNEFSIKCNGCDYTNYHISNIQGKVVQQGSVKENSPINIAELDKGIYFISLTKEGEQISRSLIKL